ncbi:MAG: gluconate:H+ symporter [Pseudomonadota bacterium]
MPGSRVELILARQAVLATMAGIALLLLLVLRFRMNTFAALLLAALVTGVFGGLSPEAALSSVQNGMGSTLGFIAPVVGLGSLFGALLEAGGAVAALARFAQNTRRLLLAQVILTLIGIIASTPVFFDVALLILLPLCLGLARSLTKPVLLLGLPLIAGLATGHAFVPPTPGPVAIADLIDADLASVAMVGLLVGVPAALVAGPLFSRILLRVGQLPSPDVSDRPSAEEAPRIAAGLAAALMVLPLALILLGAVFGGIFSFIGHPFVALLIACGASASVLKPVSGAEADARRAMIERAILPAGVVILVTGAGGAFKQVLVDTGAGTMLGEVILGWGISPVLAAFLIALTIRVAQGSATVAMVTAAGLVAPIIALAEPTVFQRGVLTIALASGASGFSHVNDSGFWLVRELFGLSVAETLKTWTLSTGLIAFTGLLLCLFLYGAA